MHRRCSRHDIRNITKSRTLVSVTILNAIGKLNFLQMDDLWWMDHQLILDFYQCHLQGRTTALVVLLLQLLNGPICRLITRSYSKTLYNVILKLKRNIQITYAVDIKQKILKLALPAYQIPKIDMACLPTQWRHC